MSARCRSAADGDHEIITTVFGTDDDSVVLTGTFPIEAQCSTALMLADQALAELSWSTESQPELELEVVYVGPSGLAALVAASASLPADALSGKACYLDFDGTASSKGELGVSSVDGTVYCLVSDSTHALGPSIEVCLSSDSTSTSNRERVSACRNLSSIATIKAASSSGGGFIELIGDFFPTGSIADSWECEGILPDDTRAQG